VNIHDLRSNGIGFVSCTCLGHVLDTSSSALLRLTHGSGSEPEGAKEEERGKGGEGRWLGCSIQASNLG